MMISESPLSCYCGTQVVLWYSAAMFAVFHCLSFTNVMQTMGKNMQMALCLYWNVLWQATTGLILNSAHCMCMCFSVQMEIRIWLDLLIRREMKNTTSHAVLRLIKWNQIIIHKLERQVLIIPLKATPLHKKIVTWEKWYNFLLFLTNCDGVITVVFIEPTWIFSIFEAQERTS